MTKLHVAWLEAPLPLLDEYGLTAAGIEDGAFRNGKHRLRTAGVDLRVHIHIRKQRCIGIRQFNPDASCSRLPVQLRIDHIDLSAELAAGKAARPDNDRLTDRESAQITLRDVN